MNRKGHGCEEKKYQPRQARWTPMYSGGKQRNAVECAAVRMLVRTELKKYVFGMYRVFG